MAHKIGRFITLESIDGAGKSTLLAGLREKLGVDVLLTCEPGGTGLGDRIREILLDAMGCRISAESELLLMFAARATLVREVIRPALDAGRWVLCERYVDASYAYQGAGRGQPEARIEALETWFCAGLRPDLTLLLDVPVDTARARVARRGHVNRIETEDDYFFERVRKAYLRRAQLEPQRFHCIDASQPSTRVLEQAWAAIVRRLLTCP